MKSKLLKQETLENKNRATFKNLIDLEKQRVPQSKSRSKSRTNVSKSRSVTKRNRKKQSQVSISIQPSFSHVSSQKMLSQPDQPSSSRALQQESKQAMKHIINMKNRVTILQQRLQQNQKTVNELSNQQNDERTLQISKVNDRFKERTDKLSDFIQQYRQEILKQTREIGETYLQKLEEDNIVKQLKQLPQISFDEIARARDLHKPDLSMWNLQEKLNRLQNQFRH